jgi:hypothetical protein
VVLELLVTRLGMYGSGTNLHMKKLQVVDDVFDEMFICKKMI